jgi:TatD DNase family protein
MHIDSHAHLTNERFAADLPVVLDQARSAGVIGILSIGTGLADAAAARALTMAHPGFIRAAAGLDPFSSHEAGAGFATALDDLRRLLAGGGFAALGECGLEFHHDLDPVPVQRDRFAAQLDLAADLRLPVVIHARSGPRGGDAHAAARELVASRPDLRGVVHSFDGDPAAARAWLDLGFHLSINGMATFKANETLRAAARAIPSDRLLIETDAPYLAPVPHRGRRCAPAMVADTAAFLADLRGERAEDLAAWTTVNAARLFGFALPTAR